MTEKITRLLAVGLVLGLCPQWTCAAEVAYPINYPINTTITMNGRVLNGVQLSSSDGDQYIAVGQGEDNLLYHDITNYCFTALSGEKVTPSFDWEGGWMHGYVYLDRANDGKFDAIVGENGTVPENSDVMSYSNYDKFNSLGVQTDNGNVGVNPPDFVMPDLEPGLYRMRYKIDWNSIDPGGNDENGVVHQQSIVTNRGAIADVMVYIHDVQNAVSVVSEHGKVYNAGGDEADGTTAESGKPLKIMIVPDAGYCVSGVTVQNGYELTLPEGVQLAGDGIDIKTTELPAYTIVNNEVTIPAACTVGNVKITVAYIPTGLDAAGDYGCALSGTKGENEGFKTLTITSGAEGTTVSTASVASDKRHLFYDKAVLHADCGGDIVPSFEFAGDAVPVHFYIDLNHDGAFVPALGEEMAKANSDAAMTAIKLPETFSTGVYRARMEAEGVAAVDFLLNIHNPECKVLLEVENGYATGDDNHGLPATMAYGAEGLAITPRVTLPGFTAKNLVLRHGHNLYGPQTIRGNRQWDEVELPVGKTTTIDPSAIDGDLLITGAFEPSDDCEWQHIWGDEFNGTELDMDKWSYHPRYASAWNRFIAQGEECPVVNKIGDGAYTAYCIPTPEEFKPGEKQPMISGAIYSAGKFYCLNGWIEARLKTTRHIGNFPAFWMMPTTSMTWPLAGEIDIFETINNENKAWQTIHTAWANQNGDHNLGKPDQPSPAKGTSEAVTVEEWHVYALEWNQDALKWYVDGELVFTYENMHYSDAIYTEFLAWPFSKPFYIICNQSVGNGSWAAQPDTQFTYHTEFDYVRVYQKKGELDYYSKADGKVSGIENVIVEQPAEFDSEQPVEYYNLQGMRVSERNLTPGIYILRQGSLTAKQMIR